MADVARLFDPLGWLSPVIIKAKIMVQQVWIHGIDWDKNLPESILNQWKTYKTELVQLNKIKVQRWTKYNPDTCTCELHGFCDATT